MSQYPSPFNQYAQSQPRPLDYSSASANVTVAQFFNAVYAWMCAGLALTAVVGWYVSTQPQILMHLGMGPILILFIAELFLVGAIAGAINRISAATATVLFLLYAAINGVVLSTLFLFYAHAVLASAFVVTAGMFGAMSLYGFLTRRDLTAMGSFLFMGLIGIILASLVSLFWHNSLLQVAINYLGVLIFVGLTAYDTQKLKAWAYQTSGNPALAARLSISGALTLYLDFLNLFLFIVQILGAGNRNR